jgi:hypothetical protein
MAARRLWRDLSPVTKKRYKAQGVTPSAYNAWNRKTPAQRAALKAEFPNLTGPAAISEKGRRRRTIIGDSFNTLKERATRNMIDVLSANASRLRPNHQAMGPSQERRIRERINVMDRRELLLASTADLDLIRRLASEQEGFRPLPDGTVVNPFWYG